MDPDVLVPLGAYAAAIMLAIGVPLTRAYVRRMDADSKQPRIPTDVAQRLARMEQTLEAVAIEVERISEGQRFTTRLLSESTGRGAASPIASGKPSHDRGP
jgi:hypothetical protein